VELFVEDRKFGLNFIVSDAVFLSSLFLVVFHQLNHFSQVGRLSNISNSSVAVLSYIHILSL